MKPAFFYLIIILFTFAASASQADDTALELYNEILQTHNPNTVLEKLTDYPIASVSEDSLKAYLYYYKGTAYGQLAVFDSARHFVSLAEEALKKGEHPLIDIQILRAQGNLNWARSFYNIALSKYQEGLKISQQIDHGEFQVSLLGNIAGVYAQLDNYELALEYALEAESVSDRVNISRPRSHMKIGLYQINLNKLDEGIQNLKESIRRIEVDHRDSIALGVCHYNIAKAYLLKNAPDEALPYLEESENILSAVGYPDPQIYLNKARYEFQKNRYRKARQIVQEALAIAEHKKSLTAQKESYEFLKVVLVNQGDFREVVNVQDKIYALNDSIKSEQIVDRVYELQTQYETEQKEAEIERLAVENELSDLKAQKFRNQLIVAIVVGLLLLVIIWLFYYYRLRKVKAERIAQEHQYDALQKRFLEILNGPQTFELRADLEELNKRLVNPLTEREYEALKLSLKGLTNKELSNELFVSESTVKFHLRNIYNKLGVSNRKEALEYVVKTS